MDPVYLQIKQWIEDKMDEYVQTVVGSFKIIGRIFQIQLKFHTHYRSQWFPVLDRSHPMIRIIYLFSEFKLDSRRIHISGLPQHMNINW